MIVGLLLALIMGVVLGLLGGGGSILTLPILVYVFDIAAKEAIATSLLVVAVTSAASVIQHARAGHVHWRTGLVFAPAAMAGAYGGGRLADIVPEQALLIGFAALMIASSLAMLRGGHNARSLAVPPTLATTKLIAEGLVVGVVTGLVGAGGGFLVVPALVLLGGMDMRSAIGTSLLVIALKSLAGVAGHLSHVSIDLELTAAITGLAILGSTLGAGLAKQADPARLRRGFGWFVLAMGLFVVGKEAPQSVWHAVFVDRWPFWVGGIAVGTVVLALLIAGRKTLGVSTGYADALAACLPSPARETWRIRFMVGIVVGAAVAGGLGGQTPSLQAGLFDDFITSALPFKAALFTFGGIFLGFGARLAGGCTSGHGIVGMAQLARSSWLATTAFMVGGGLAANLLFRVIGRYGGWS